MRAKTIAILALAAAIAGIASAPPTWAQKAPAPVSVGRQGDGAIVDQAIVDRALAFLNGARSMKSRFVQRDLSGGYWTGAMWVSRPGRLRFQYDPPENDVIWSTGGLINHFDAELETVSHAPRSATPAWFLLDDKVRISDDVEVLATAVQQDRFFVTAARKENVDDGRVTLAFQADPDRLLGWTTTGGDGQISQVDLIELRVGGELDDDIFDFRPPIPEYNDR